MVVRINAAAAAKLFQSCPSLCNLIDGSPPGSPVPGILQARTLEWVAISFSNAWKWKVKVKSLSCVRLFTTAWTAAYQAPPSMGFSRQEDWSGVPLPLHVQCNPYPNIKGSFRRTRTNNLKFCMEIEKAPNSQKNLGKEETVLRKRTELEESCSLTSDYTTKIQQSAVIKTV